MDLHEHFPTPDDVRAITVVSKEGRIVFVGPEQYPAVVCLLPDCPLNRRLQRGEGAQDPNNPADEINAPGGDGKSTSNPAAPNDQMATKSKLPPGSMVYNEWGELVDPESIRANASFRDLEPRSMFRLVNLNWHFRYKRRLDTILAAQLEGDSPFDDGPLTLSGRLMSWELKTTANQARMVRPEAAFKIAVYDGPPRVLDIGCDAGGWCLAVKKQHPDWIVEGVDDIDRWVENRGNVFKDFMDGEGPEIPHFGRIHMTQAGPEFTLRPYGMLLSHKTKPIPLNLYGFVHGRDIFARIENYRSFLDDVRQILQPDGVIEFSEIDPRPRTKPTGPAPDDPNDHTSRPVTGFSRNIADRFTSPMDAELATDVPNWTARVDARLSSALRPRDGIAAANLKSWVEGAGFWDVKEVVVQLVIGGESHRGQLMLSFILFQIMIENHLKKIEKEFPISEADRVAMESGKYFLNLHIVTGRKPLQPRPGDMLIDGTRQGMGDPYSDMTHYPLTRATHWERFAKFDMTGGIATSALNRFNAPNAGVVPNLRDRISSLRLHGLSIGYDDFNDGSMMGSGSGTSSSAMSRFGSGLAAGERGYSVGLTRPPIFNPAGRGSGPSTGPPIPWATRPNMEEYYAARAARQNPTEANPGSSGVSGTEAASTQIAVPSSNTHGDISTGATVTQPISNQTDTTVSGVAASIVDNAITANLDTTTAAATVDDSAAAVAPALISESATVETFQTEATTSGLTAPESIPGGAITPAIVGTDTSGAVPANTEAPDTRVSPAEPAITGATYTEVAHTTNAAPEVVSSASVIASTVSSEVPATDVVFTRAVSTEVSTEAGPAGDMTITPSTTTTLATGDAITDLLSTGFLSTEVVPANIIPLDITATDVISSSGASVTGTTSQATEAAAPITGINHGADIISTTSQAIEETAPITDTNYGAAIASANVEVQAGQILEISTGAITQSSTTEATVPTDPASTGDIGAANPLQDDPAATTTAAIN